MHDVYLVISTNGDITFYLDPAAARAAAGSAAKIRLNTLCPQGKLGTITGSTGSYGFSVTTVTAQGNKHADNY